MEIHPLMSNVGWIDESAESWFFLVDELETSIDLYIAGLPPYVDDIVENVPKKMTCIDLSVTEGNDIDSERRGWGIAGWIERKRDIPSGRGGIASGVQRSQRLQ